MTYLVADHFAGGGGATCGACRVARIKVVFAANHWDPAIATHSVNYPHIEHAQADLSQMHPGATPWTHILWSSPACTYHTIAQGRLRDDQAARMSRATMWSVAAFAEYHRYEAIVLENVLEVRRWTLWDAWVKAMTDLGYHLSVMSLNSALLGVRVPQWRDRLYVVATRAPFDATPLLGAQAVCQVCGPVSATRVGKVGRYKRSYSFICPKCAKAVEPDVRPGRELLDLSQVVQPVGDRFAQRTRAKIQMGLDRFGGQPFVAELRGGGSTVRSLAEPISTVTAGGNHHLVVVPDGPRIQNARAQMLGVKERARAQGFPDDYVFCGKAKDVVTQIGNAVSTNAAATILTAVADHLDAA